MNAPTLERALAPPTPGDVGAARLGVLRRAAAQVGVRVGLVLGGAVVVVVVLGPMVWTASPTALAPADRFLAPDLAHPLGTDALGRDVLARTMVGGRQSLVAALAVLAGTFSIGLGVGVAAAALGRVVDGVLMRLVDVVLAIPGIVLTLAVIGVLGRGFGNLLLALVITSWAGSARLARSFVLDARTRPDVVAARMAGVGWGRVIAGHLVPQAALRLLAVATLDLGHTVLVIAGLSFLGVGAEPGAAEWGAMLADSRSQLQFAPWTTVGPCAGIVAAVLATTLLGDGLTDTIERSARP